MPILASRLLRRRWRGVCMALLGWDADHTKLCAANLLGEAGNEPIGLSDSRDGLARDLERACNEVINSLSFTCHAAAPRLRCCLTLPHVVPYTGPAKTLAGVVEWQTRRSQKPLGASS